MRIELSSVSVIVSSSVWTHVLIYRLLCLSDIKACTPNPCRHGKCTTTASGYKCTCDHGYTGTNCESACDPAPKPNASIPWSDWTGFSRCPVTCGTGLRTRTRKCLTSSTCSDSCVGNSYDMLNCRGLPGCCDEVRDGWTYWTRYDKCSKPCFGTQMRQRRCKSLINEGNPNCSYLCSGNSQLTRICNVGDCCADHIHGWSVWIKQKCSVPCGGGTYFETRNCKSSPGSKCHSLCKGRDRYTGTCNTEPCCDASVRWSSWSEYSRCSRTCGSGTRIRNRTCASDTGCRGNCSGPATDVKVCQNEECCSVSTHGWTEWVIGECSRTCGGGTKIKRRTCKSNGTSCSRLCRGASSLKLKCGSNTCCDDRKQGWTYWSTYGRCSKTCGTGTRRRRRACQGARTDCAYLCSGPNSETQRCGGPDQCCDDSTHGWAAWTVNTTCTRTCGNGLRQWSRQCKSQGSTCSYLCIGTSTRQEFCNTQECCNEYTYGWTKWFPHGSCSTTCGIGTRRKTRRCQGAGTDCSYICSGPSALTESCGSQQCCDEYTFGWTAWSKHGSCSKTCGTGIRRRTRRCQGVGSNCSDVCSGPSAQTESCGSQQCCDEQTLGWSAWSQYGSCSTTCGTGTRRRTRRCQGAGTDCSYVCSGPDSETESCQHCCGKDSTHGWAAWKVTHECSHTCNGIIRYSRRCRSQGNACSHLCAGVSTKIEACNKVCCDKQTHGWAPWSKYGNCSKTCGTGTRQRTRTCKSSGTDCSYLCSGPSSETGRCAIQQCCEDSTHGWTAWTVPNTCTKSCGGGYKRKSRHCKSQGTSCSHRCSGEHWKLEPCNEQDCCEDSTHGWTPWTITNRCTQTCGGGGVKRYSRRCKGQGTSCSRLCDGTSTKEEACNSQTCCDQQEHGWTAWSRYGRCSRTCGTGTRRRTRTCKGAGTDCSYLCSGSNSERRNCGTQQCCVDSEHGWTAWSSFGRCSQNCGEGTQQRSRRCRAAGTECAEICVGAYTDSRECTLKAARNGGWSEWRDEGCSATCGSGTISLSRTCTNPAPNECGRQCSGNSIAHKSCTGLVSCCQEGRQTGASITLNHRSVTVESDPNAARVGVIMTCQAVTCPGDTVKRIALGKVVDSETTIDYVTAETGFSGGQALDNINRPHTQVSGSIAQSSLTYVLTKIRCEDKGTYRCSTVIKKNDKRNDYDKTAAITVKVNPGRFSVTPLVPINNFKVGEELLLNCSGSVGTFNADTQIELVWEYKNNDDTSWTRVKKPDISSTLVPLPDSCQHMTTWSVLKIVLVNEDNNRRYRCFLKKDGDDLDDDSPDDDTFLVMINSLFSPVARTVLTINPRTLTLVNADKKTAMIVCKGLQSQNKLISLVLAFKATQQSVTLQPKELAITDQPESVTSKVEPEKASVSGGIVPQAINYTLLEVTCADAGTYVCTAVTELATETRTYYEEKTFDVEIYYFHTTPKRTIVPNGGVQLTCSTLIRFDNENQDVKWHWQSTPTDPDSGVAVWTDISPTSKYVTVSDTTITPSHRCFVVSTSTLTIKDIPGSAEVYLMYHRCFVSDGDTTYDSTASEFGTDRPPSEKESSSTNQNLILGLILGGVMLLCLFTILYNVLKRREENKHSHRRRGSHISSRRHSSSRRPSFSSPPTFSSQPSFSRPFFTEPSTMIITTTFDDDDDDDDSD